MSSPRAFTIRELIAVIGVFVVIGALLVVALPRGRAESRRQKDGNQIRAVQQSLVTWAQNGSDDYPTPSRVDRMNYTVPEVGRAKDTTANIFALLLSVRSVTPDLLVSPIETNQNIGPAIGYEYSNRQGAVNPDLALWDPRFSAALDGTRQGNVSYAHLQPAGQRRGRWSNTFAASEAVLSNRGPQIASTTINSNSSVTPTLALRTSNTLRFYGRGRTWSGWAAFNDNHVDFRSDYLKSGRAFNPTGGPIYTTGANSTRPDIWCYDEPDDPKAANDFLGIFLKAGDTPSEFKAAWD